MSSQRVSDRSRASLLLRTRVRGGPRAPRSPLLLCGPGGWRRLLVQRPVLQQFLPLWGVWLRLPMTAEPDNDVHSTVFRVAVSLPNIPPPFRADLRLPLVEEETAWMASASLSATAAISSPKVVTRRRVSHEPTTIRCFRADAQRE